MAKPSSIRVVRAKRAKLLPSSFKAITLFGTVYCNSDKDVEEINKSDKVDSTLKCHETIHVRQAESIHDSWILFYLVYAWEWICNLPLIFIDAMAPYKLMPLELEAYHDEDKYLTEEYPTTVCAKWKKYADVPLRIKWKIASEYYKKKVRPLKDIIDKYIKLD